MQLGNIVFIILLICAYTSDAQAKNFPINSVENMTKQSISAEVEARIRNFFHRSPGMVIQPYNQQLITITIGARSFFASRDGRYIYVGKVIDSQLKIDISEQLAQQNRLNILAEVDDSLQLVFPATGEELFAVTLFTDIDCGYCRRFHSQMAQYNALGIRINYLMLPRAGKHSASYDKTAAVLCSLNRQENMTLAMQGRLSTLPLPAKRTCQKELDQQMLLSTQLGIAATPTILLPNGGIIEGALSPEQLLAQLKSALL